MLGIMSERDPIDVLFGGMEKLGPGDDASTVAMLESLPTRLFDVVVDAGCGTGRQTLALARALGTPIQAVDSHEPFLSDLRRRATTARLAHLIHTHCMDMKDVGSVWPRIDLLWSEGAAYNIGFGHALSTWARAIHKCGFAVVSELCWLRNEAPTAVLDFFRSCYPDMRSMEQNVTIARSAGYDVLATLTLPRDSWVDGYYDVLGPRAQALLNHEDAGVREFAAATLEEIEIFDASEGSYGYVFYVLQRS